MENVDVKNSMIIHSVNPETVAARKMGRIVLRNAIVMEAANQIQRSER